MKCDTGSMTVCDRYSERWIGCVNCKNRWSKPGHKHLVMELASASQLITDQVAVTGANNNFASRRQAAAKLSLNSENEVLKQTRCVVIVRWPGQPP
jgi:hypothetical protein